MNKLYFLLVMAISSAIFASETMADTPVKPRILISTDIGGTDPDDNQSILHLMMYSDLFDIEGLVSSPSFGSGSKEELLREIGVYEKDYPILKKTYSGLLSPDSLRSICKQGRRGLASFAGYDVPTEGSEWIVECARRESDRPLYVLVWGTLEDVAQALHDAPDIKDNIRVYWIGGPNKKWGVNSYVYVVRNFPDLWMIENNASYRGLIGSKNIGDDYNAGYYDRFVKGAGHMGADFINYYEGVVKMGDTPSLLYMMDGNPDDPTGESWGGSFEKISESPYTVFSRNTCDTDTVATYSVVEYQFDGPIQNESAIGSKFFTFNIDKQDWDGVYIGEGKYAVRYSPKQPAVLHYTVSSELKDLDGQSGTLVVSELWPSPTTSDGIKLGPNWYTDRQDTALFDGKWQGAKTISKHRKAILDDWNTRWQLLK